MHISMVILLRLSPLLADQALIGRHCCPDGISLVVHGILHGMRNAAGVKVLGTERGFHTDSAPQYKMSPK